MTDPELLEAIRDAEVEIAVRVLHPEVAGFSAWLTGDVVVMALPGPAGELEIAAIPAGSFASQIARLVDLGPRAARSPARLELRKGVLEALLQGDATAAEVLGDDALKARPVLSRPRAHWIVDAVAGPAGRSLHVLDSEDEGLWLVQDGDGTVVLDRVSPTDVWRLLTSLLAA